MASIFTSTPGVGRNSGISFTGTPGTAIITVGGVSTSSSLLFTGVGFNQRANSQYMQSLRRQIYIYAFGDRMGVLKVNGVALWSVCPTGGATASPLANGINTALGYFKAFSVGSNSITVLVNIGTATIAGYVDGVSASIIDREKGLIGFQWTFMTMPDLWTL